MTEHRLQDLSVEQLIEEYNELCPVKRLTVWQKSRQELLDLVRIARKQATPDGVVKGITVMMPD